MTDGSEEWHGAGGFSPPPHTASILQTLQQEVEELRLERLQLASQSRMKDQDVKEMAAEVSRLNNLVTSMQAQHKSRLAGAVGEREHLQKKLNIAEDAAKYHERECEAAREDLSTSLVERETLVKTVEGLLRAKEDSIAEMHKAQDSADAWELKWEQLAAEKAHGEEELAALRANSDFNEQYIRTIKASHERVQEEACRLQAELAGVLQRQQREPLRAPNALAAPPVQDTHYLHHEPPPEPLVHTEEDRHYYHPHQHQHQYQHQHQHPHPHQHPHYSAQHPPPPPPPPHRDDVYGSEPTEAAEDYGHRRPPWEHLDDPLSPYRPARGRRYEEREDRPHPHQAEHDGSPREGSMSPAHDAEMQRMQARIDKLQADLHMAKTEDGYVQREYVFEAAERLNGALGGLEMLVAVMQDWKAGVACGRDPWGTHPNEEEAQMRRRTRELQKRVTLKQEMSRSLRHSGLGEEVASILELFFAAGRVRETVTYACESFQAGKEAADAAMLGARRTIEESLDSAKKQQDSMDAAKHDAGHMDGKLRELTQARFEAENQLESMKRQIEERDAYQSQVDRMTSLMKQEAQEEREKMSAIALKITDKHNDELQKLAAKQKEEIEALTEKHVQHNDLRQREHTQKVEEMAAELQAVRDEMAAMEKNMEEKHSQLATATAKKKSHKVAKEGLLSEMMNVKRAAAGMTQENKELKHKVKQLEQENRVLRDLSSKLESDVRRGRILIDGEAERNAFAAWRRGMLGGYDRAPSERSVSASTQPPAVQRRSTSARRTSHSPFVIPDDMPRQRECTLLPGAAYITGSPQPPGRGV